MSANAYPLTAITKTPVLKLVEYAFRDCGLLAEQQTPQLLEAARQALQYLLQDLSNRGEILFLWRGLLLGTLQNKRELTLPKGTVDVRFISWISTRNFIASSALPPIAAPAFSGSLDTPVVGQSSIGLDLGVGNANVPTYFGWNAYSLSGEQSYSIAVQYSNDGFTWNNFGSTFSASLGNREWQYYKLDGAPSARFWQLVGTAPGVRQIVFGNSISVIPLARLNYTDYLALPNKDQNYGGRSLQYWFDRQIDPIINFWPVPQDDFQIFEAELEQQMPDVGNLSSSVAIPSRWLNAVQTGLSAKLALQLPSVAPDRILALQQFALDAMTSARGEERDKAPFYLRPNFSYYTR